MFCIDFSELVSIPQIHWTQLPSIYPPSFPATHTRLLSEDFHDNLRYSIRDLKAYFGGGSNHIRDLTLVMASVSTIIAIAMLMVHAFGSDSAGHSNLTTVSSSVESIVNGVLEVDERGGSSQTQHSNVTLQHHIKPKLKWESRLPDTGTEAR